MHDINLAASVSSRICHDLVSPVGAVVNGIDLMREMGASDPSEALGMIGQSAERASALLQLYRIGFGTAEAEAEGVPRALLDAHSAVLFSPPRIVLDWHGREGPALPRREARLLILLMLCARSSLGIRGSVLLRTGAESALPLSIEVTAETLSSSADFLTLLEHEADAPQIVPRTVEFVLARDAALELDLRLRVTRSDGRFTISADRRR